jgi:glycosyltransferase involved in cell wall biosynthesis
MPLNIIHFSQDFRKDKSQLGAFSRTFNLTMDGNRHIIFTAHFGDEEISGYVFEHLEIVSIGIGKREFRGRFERSLSTFIGERILSYLLTCQIQVDLLYGHAQLINYKILFYMKRKLHKSLIWDVNTIWGLPLFDSGSFLFKLYYFLSAHIAYRKCVHLIAQTEQCKQVIEKSYGIPDKKITVITNSINLDQFKIKKQYSQSFSDRPLNVFFVGRFDELNGADFILDNIEMFDPMQTNLNLVGTGTHLDRIDHLHKSGKLTYHGVVPYSEMPEILLRADLLLIPRVRCFGSNHFIPTKLLEGMGCGLLVLGSDVGGISEVIRDWQNGFLFHAGDPKDMVAQINKIKSLDCVALQKISDMAVLDISRDYDLTINCQKINSVYDKILST